MKHLHPWVIAVLLVTPAASQAQEARRAPHPSKVFVEISLPAVAESLAQGREFTIPFVIFGENASMGAAYPRPGRAKSRPIDLGGGWMFKRWLGVGAAFSRTTYEHLVAVSATIPHPFFFNRPASAIRTSDAALAAREKALHLFVAFSPVRTDRVELRLVGGPSFFSYSADMVESVLYSQEFGESTPANSIAISGITSQDAHASGNGVHAGADFAYFLYPRVGVAMGARYSRGTVTLDEEPLSQLSQQFRVGNKLVFLGVRLRLRRAQ